jgi:hydroxypyruvate isomerase
LVWTRGDLHHFANNPNKTSGSPLTHEEYEGIAMLARYLSRRGLMLQMERLNTQANPGSYTAISANYC